MQIIQASGSCSCSRAQLAFLNVSSSSLHLHSRTSSYWVLSVKPKVPSRRKLISTHTDNSTSDSVSTKIAEVDQSLVIKKRASELSRDLRGTSIFLVGINNSYKSSVGRILADALRYYYFDSDGLVEEAAGGKAAAMTFIEKNEEGYLASETEVLKQLSSMGRLVVSAGNGAVKDSTNLALLRHGISIWIDVPLDMIARELIEERIQLSASDAQICKSSSEVLDQLTALYNNGRSGYSTSDATISLQKVASNLGYDELDVVTAEDLCLEVIKELEKLTRVKKMMEEAARPF